MRASGVVDAPRGLGPGDHLCWVYRDVPALSAAVVAFLAEGIDRGERVSFVSARSVSDARRVVEPVGDVDDLVARGVLTVASLDDAFRAEPCRPQHQADASEAAARAAVADGFTGLRVAVDVTPLTHDPVGRRDLARYEHLIERRMPRLPFTALCLFDGSADADPTAELACLHPATNVPATAFHLTARPDGTIVLSGELDITTVGLLRAALAHADDGHHEVHVDGTALRFLDHRTLLVLDQLPGVTRLVLTTRSKTVAHVARLLELDHVVVVLEV